MISPSPSPLSRSHPRRSKRAQSQKTAHGPAEPSPVPEQRSVRFSLPAAKSSQHQRRSTKTLKLHPVNSQREALTAHIRVLNARKRRTRLFNQVSLCVVTVCMGKNVLRKISKRGGASSIWGEAFQSHGKEPSNARLWPAFGRHGDGMSEIPPRTLQPFGSYPNILNITPEMRREFHPVVKIPRRKRKGKQHGTKDNTGTCIESEAQQRRTFRWPWQKGRKSRHQSSCPFSSEATPLHEIYDYEVRDFTGGSRSDDTVLLNGGRRVPQLVSSRAEALEYARLPPGDETFDVGRYDEDRRNMYTSSLFVEEDAGRRRTVHVGLDVGAPVGTPVYAFADGVVHAAGYNPELGDYGHVVVVAHAIAGRPPRGKEARHDGEGTTQVYALYGHLGAKSGKGKRPGQTIAKGQVVGYVGSVAENGGWTGTHLHFQLGVHPPETHDMPGAVAMANREEALLEYVDPRYVVGELY